MADVGPIDALLLAQKEDFRAGRRRPPEDYLAGQPGLARHADALLELVVHEVLLRQEAGESPRLEEYQRLFPELASRLPRFFDLIPAFVDLPLDSPNGADPTTLVPASRPTLSCTPDNQPTRPAEPDAAAPARGAAPARVGSHVLLEELGRGGWGVVYRARDERLGRVVALKTLVRGAAAAADERGRFLDEARKAAGLAHPHLVTIYEVGTADDGLPYFTMELAEGGSLLAALQAGPWPAADAARLVEALARAVQHAHGRGLIHRDLKPANVLLAADGTPKVADFGLARRVEDGNASRTLIVGTPNYMAPEQLSGDPRRLGWFTDVYGLGAVLYEVLTGRPPFLGPSVEATLRQVATADPPPPRALRPDVPVDLETICLKCLEKEPRRRYPSAEALADELRRFLNGEPIQARPPGWWGRAAKYARRHPARAGLMAASAALAALALYYVYQNGVVRDLKAEAGAARTEAAQDKEERTKAEAGRRAARYATTIFDATTGYNKRDVAEIVRRLEESRPRRGEDDLRGFEWYHLWKLAHAERRTLQMGEPVAAVALSPDGKTAVALGLVSHALAAWDTETGLPRNLPPIPPANSMALSGDGRWLALSLLDRRIRIQPLDLAGASRDVARPRNFAGIVVPVALSPDGKWLAAGTTSGTVEVWDLTTGVCRAVSRMNGSAVLSVAFSPDGTRLAAGGMRGGVALWDGLPGNAGGLLHEVWNLPELARGVAGEHGVHAVAFTPPGAGPPLLATAGDDKVVSLRRTADGGEVGTLPGHTAPARALTFSPDGRTLVSAGDDAVLRVWDVAGQPWRERAVLLGHDQPIYSVGLAGDGRSLASASADGTVKVWDLRPERDGMRRVLAGPGKHVRTVAVGGDGPALLTLGDDHRLLVREAPDQEPRVVGEQVVCAALSPDGARVAWVVLGAGEQPVLRLQEIDKAGRTRELRGIHQQPRSLTFSPDGKRLVLAFAEEPPCLVNVADFDAPPAQPFTEIARGPTRAVWAALAFRPDGVRLALAGQWYTGLENRREPPLHGVQVCDPEGQEALVTLFQVRGPYPQVLSLAYAPDGAALAWGRNDGVVTLTGAGGKVLRDIPTGAGAVQALAFAPDGKTLATAGEEVRLWDPATGDRRFVLATAPDRPVSLAFDPGGRWLVAGTDRGNTLLWEAATDPAARGRKE